MPIEHQPNRQTLPEYSEERLLSIEESHRSCPYASPFEDFVKYLPDIKRFENLSALMAYKGTFRNACEEISGALNNPLTFSGSFKLAVYPPLLTRATLD